MKIPVDEMPVRPSDCPFFVHNGFKECKLDDFEDYECVNVADCPYLKVLEEKDDLASSTRLLSRLLRI